MVCTYLYVLPSPLHASNKGLHRKFSKYNILALKYSFFHALDYEVMAKKIDHRNFLNENKRLPVLGIIKHN